jgi:hypothetical protein
MGAIGEPNSRLRRIIVVVLEGFHFFGNGVNRDLLRL